VDVRVGKGPTTHGDTGLMGLTRIRHRIPTRDTLG